MQKHTVAVSAEWIQWVTENLKRGCDQQTLVATMVNANIDPIVAGITVLQIMGQQKGLFPAYAPLAQPDAPNAQDYRYETPRFPMDRNFIRTYDKTVRVVMRSQQPVIAVVDDLLSLHECDELIALSKEKLKQSTIVDPLSGEIKPDVDRYSHGAVFSLGENPFIERLDRRIAELMHWPIEHGEGLQTVNYQIGGEYKPHFDYFPPHQDGNKLHVEQHGQRVSTLVIYLNDVEEGGETIFPELHLSVVPKRGSAVYFEYANSMGQLDTRSLHAGAPVRSGNKWIATKFMRNKRY